MFDKKEYLTDCIGYLNSELARIESQIARHEESLRSAQIELEKVLAKRAALQAWIDSH